MIPNDKGNITLCQTSHLASHAPSVIVHVPVPEQVCISRIECISYPISASANSEYLNLQ